MGKGVRVGARLDVIEHSPEKYALIRLFYLDAHEKVKQATSGPSCILSASGN